MALVAGASPMREVKIVPMNHLRLPLRRNPCVRGRSRACPTCASVEREMLSALFGAAAKRQQKDMAEMAQGTGEDS